MYGSLDLVIVFGLVWLLRHKLGFFFSGIWHVLRRALVVSPLRLLVPEVAARWRVGGIEQEFVQQLQGTVQVNLDPARCFLS